MAVVRRHWKLAVLNALLFASLVGIFFLRFIGDSKADQPQDAGTQASAADLDRVALSSFDELRQKLCLTSHDLAAIGCNQQDAERVLTGLLAWYRNNQGILQQANHARQLAQRQMNETQRRINLGPRDESMIAQIPDIQQQVDAAAIQETALLQSAKAITETHLNVQQRALWAASLSNSVANLPSRYRYVPGLTGQQQADLQQTFLRHGQISPELLEAEQTLIGTSGKQAIDIASANTSLCITGVLAAEQAMLPQPAVVRGPLP